VNRTADALTNLALDLGLNSAVINRYASARGLNQQVAAPVAEQPTSVPTAPVAPATQEPAHSDSKNLRMRLTQTRKPIPERRASG
jgi:hypothetical protein